MQVALYEQLIASVGESEQPAHGCDEALGLDVSRGVVFRQGGHVDEVNAPFRLDEAAAVFDVVGISVNVPSEPHGNSARVGRQITLESLCVRFAVYEVEIAGSLWRTVGEVAAVSGPPFAVGLFFHSFPEA